MEETDRGSFIGSIAGYGGGTFDTIYSNAIVVGRDAGIGGIFGQVRLEDYAESFFMNCWYDGTIKLYNGWLAGGIVGDMQARLDAARSLLYETARNVDMNYRFADLARERALTPEERAESKIFSKNFAKN